MIVFDKMFNIFPTDFMAPASYVMARCIEVTDNGFHQPSFRPGRRRHRRHFGAKHRAEHISHLYSPIDWFKGKITGKSHMSWTKTMVSCRFSFQLIHWTSDAFLHLMRWSMMNDMRIIVNRYDEDFLYGLDPIYGNVRDNWCLRFRIYQCCHLQLTNLSLPMGGTQCKKNNLSFLWDTPSWIKNMYE